MSSTRTIGRLIGALLLIQILGGVMVNFVLTAPLFAPPGFLVNASLHVHRIGLSALCGLATGAISLAIAISILKVVGERAGALSHWLFALATAGFAATVVEQGNVMSMVSLSHAYAAAPASTQEILQSVRIVVAASRNWSHYLGLVVAGSMVFVFYATLYRVTLVPRALAMFGMAAAALQIIAVAMPLFGQSIVFLMLAPLGVSQLALALWLMAKGFPVPAGESSA